MIIASYFQTSPDVFKLGYEEKLYDFMQECVIEVERRIKRNKQRLDQNKDEESTVNPVSLKILKAKRIQGTI